MRVKLEGDIQLRMALMVMYQASRKRLSVSLTFLTIRKNTWLSEETALIMNIAQTHTCLITMGMPILAEMSRLAALPAMIMTRQQKHMLTHIAEAASRGIGIKTTRWRLTTLRTVRAHTWGMKRYTMERRLPRL